jgi:hypothetical protein
MNNQSRIKLFHVRFLSGSQPLKASRKEAEDGSSKDQALEITESQE